MNREDLKQIADLMDAKLGPISERIDRVESDITGMKDNISIMKDNISTMKSDISTLKDDTRQTRVLLEQQQHQIQLIAEQYTDIAEKLDKANERAAQMDDFQTRLRAVEIAVMRHSAILKEAQ